MQEADMCPRCGETKPRDWRLCFECTIEAQPGFDGWPNWLQEYVRMLDRDRKADGAFWDKSIPLGEFSPFRDMPGALSEVLLTRPFHEMAWVDDDLLPYAPYDNDGDNQAYRRANGIPERA